MSARTREPTSRRERRIIERPRLTKLLDESEARIILLVAPAGYGKTTLAKQWAKTLNRAIWVTCTPAHRDVTVFAQHLARGLDALGVESTPFITQYLSGRSNPQRAARDVAYALSRQFGLANVQWLILDDYHTVVQSRDIDEMIAVLRNSEVEPRLLMASRVRPEWITARDVLYGDAEEIRADALAMDVAESTALLGGSRASAEFCSRAHGWPAVLALAAGLEENIPAEIMPSTLHRYVAEELLNSAPTSLQRSLIELVLLPDLSPETLATHVKNAPVIIRTARELGFVTGDSELELHPLVREFLFLKLREFDDWEERAKRAVTACITGEYWDRAFELLSRFEFPELVPALLQASYKPLLTSGRIGTLSQFVAEARIGTALPPRELDVVDAEVALRDGVYELARDLGCALREQIPAGHPLQSRAASIEGSAAFHLADFQRSDSAFAAAHALSTDEFDLIEALHGRVLTALFGESDAVDHHISELGQWARRTGSPKHVARHASAVVSRMRIGGGFVNSSSLDDALRVLPYVDDPRIKTGVMVAVTYALGLQCEYVRASALAKELLREVEAFDLDFARPHGLWNFAFVQIGLRRFGDASRSLHAIRDVLSRRHLGHHAMNAAALQARLLVQLARPQEAYQYVQAVDHDPVAPMMLGEYRGTRALCLAVSGRLDQALAEAAIAADISISSEVQVLASGVRAIVAAASGDQDTAHGVVELAKQRRTWDPLVCCLRASSDLADCLAANDAIRPELERLYELSRDYSLARRAGLRVRSTGTPAEVLSPRELEVLDLIAQGFRTRDIADAFTISPSTVKVHVQHILEKLGVRTRTEAVARLRRVEDG